MRCLMVQRERGQATVEFGLIAVVLFMITIGLLDVGRAFYQYNAVANAARFGARFGAVVGGTCSDTYNPPSAGDWCNQGALAGAAPTGCPTSPLSGIATFWASNGNWPCHAPNPDCPHDYNSAFSGLYTVSDFSNSTYPSIVGMIAKRFDTNSSSSVVTGSTTPGFDLSKMKVCIALSLDPFSGGWSYKPGAKVTVYVYYPFSAVGPLLGATHFNLVASSQYTIE